jgi:hypothetical protein
MGQCATCGNTYDKSFDVMMAGKTYTFDSFECAVQSLAPVCPHCHCKVIGHGVENGVVYCCAIAKSQGEAGQGSRLIIFRPRFAGWSAVLAVHRLGSKARTRASRPERPMKELKQSKNHEIGSAGQRRL